MDIIPVKCAAGYEKVTVLCPGFLAGDSMLQGYRVSLHRRKLWRGKALPPAHDLIYLPAKLADCLMCGICLDGSGRFAG